MKRRLIGRADLMEAPFALGKRLTGLFNEVLMEVFNLLSLGFNLGKRKIVFEGDVIEILGRDARPESKVKLPKMGTFGDMVLVVFAFHGSFKF